MKKTITTVVCFLFTLLVKSQGLEGIIVEKYYVSDAADSIGSSGILPVGSVTYRIYVDMQTGYNFQALYGVPGHTMSVSTTTSFFNNEDYGNTNPNGISSTNIRKNTTMLDSWFSVGATCNGKMGVLKSEDMDGSVGNANGILANNDPSAGNAISSTDGMMPGTPLSVTFVGLNNTGNGDLAVIDGISQTGNLFTTDNGSVAALGGASGPTASNRVLVGQFTTDGILSFELNLQLGTPSGGTENYVATNPVGNEIQSAALTYSSLSTGLSDVWGSHADDIEIYPNPSSSIFHLKSDGAVASSAPIHYEIRNSFGQTVRSQNVSNGGTCTFDLSNCSDGTYFIYRTANNLVTVHKLVKF